MMGAQAHPFPVKVFPLISVPARKAAPAVGTPHNPLWGWGWNLLNPIQVQWEGDPCKELFFGFFSLLFCAGRRQQLLSHPGCAVGLQARLEQSQNPPQLPHSSRALQLQLFLQL